MAVTGGLASDGMQPDAAPDPAPEARVDFFDHPRPFLDAAGDLLRAQPLQGSVLATASERTVRELAAGHDSWREVGAPFARWWTVVRDRAGTAVTAMMRTAPFAPYPVYTLALDRDQAALVARTLHERGERLGGVNGVLPGADLLARETARLSGGTAAQRSAMRLWEATEVAVPPAPAGRLRRATEQEAGLVLAWFDEFHGEADRQAGREPAESFHNTPELVLSRIRDGAEWVWEDPDGRVVHLTGRNLPAYGVARIGPVYTPREHRGRGIASHVVAELTRQGLAEGVRMCLFTDLDNPVSNRIYARMGYQPVGDTGEWVVTGAAPRLGGDD